MRRAQTDLGQHERRVAELEDRARALSEQCAAAAAELATERARRLEAEEETRRERDAASAAVEREVRAAARSAAEDEGSTALTQTVARVGVEQLETRQSELLAELAAARGDLRAALGARKRARPHARLALYRVRGSAAGRRARAAERTRGALGSRPTGSALSLCGLLRAARRRCRHPGGDGGCAGQLVVRVRGRRGRVDHNGAQTVRAALPQRLGALAALGRSVQDMCVAPRESGALAVDGEPDARRAAKTGQVAGAAPAAENDGAVANSAAHHSVGAAPSRTPAQRTE